MLACKAQPDVHFLLEYKQLQTSYRNLPISGYQKIPQLSKQILLSSVTLVLLYKMTSLTASYDYLILTNAVLLSVSLSLNINPQRSHTK